MPERFINTVVDRVAAEVAQILASQKAAPVDAAAVAVAAIGVWFVGRRVPTTPPELLTG